MENGTITGAGMYEAVLNVGMCQGFESYNAFTGIQGVSTMYIEEMPHREWRGRVRKGESRRVGEREGGLGEGREGVRGNCV